MEDGSLNTIPCLNGLRELQQTNVIPEEAEDAVPNTDPVNKDLLLIELINRVDKFTTSKDGNCL